MLCISRADSRKGFRKCTYYWLWSVNACLQWLQQIVQFQLAQWMEHIKKPFRVYCTQDKIQKLFIIIMVLFIFVKLQCTGKRFLIHVWIAVSSFSRKAYLKGYWLDSEGHSVYYVGSCGWVQAWEINDSFVSVHAVVLN